MPRAEIRSADYNFVPISADSGQDGPIEWPERCRLGRVNVGWSKKPTGHVEISTFDESVVYGPHGLVEQVRTAIEHDADVETIVRDFFANNSGFHISLDRDGCNEVIRRVREARIAAFGRDE